MTTSNSAPAHLLCVLGPLTLGFAALQVREVMALPFATPLSEAAPLVAGAVNLRGRVVPLLDLRAALGLEITPPTAHESLIVLENDGQIVAVRVDEVRDVQLLSHEEIAYSAPPLSSNNSASFMAGLARHTSDIVQIVHLPALFQAALAPTKALHFDAQSGGALNWRAPWFAPAPADRAILQERAQTLAKPVEPSGGAPASAHSNGDASGQYLSLAAALINGEIFGFELSMVREFAPLRSLTRVPMGPNAILGLLNLRGEILPLIDIRPALGMKTGNAPRPAATGTGRADATDHSLMEVVVVEHETQRVAVWVEQVLDVFVADSARCNATAPGQMLRGAVPYGPRMLAVLNLPAVLAELSAMA